MSFVYILVQDLERGKIHIDGAYWQVYRTLGNNEFIYVYIGVGLRKRVLPGVADIFSETREIKLSMQIFV